MAENVAEAIAAALSAVRSLAVMTPKSLHATQRDPQSLARELNARYFLTGMIMPMGSRLRVVLVLNP
jgi:TolB-like protein